MRLELDHLVLAGPSLDALGRAAAERGMTALPGGRHGSQGTHNALIGLEGGRYLELLAPDPAGTPGDWSRGLAGLEAPSLHAVCLRVPEAAAWAEALAAAGFGVRRLPGSRQLPDGRELRWELVFAVGHGYGGAMPFFIDWSGSPHPSAGLPPAARLLGLAVRHPDAEALAARLGALAELPAEMAWTAAASRGLLAELEGPAGRWTLAGAGDGMLGG